MVSQSSQFLILHAHSSPLEEKNETSQSLKNGSSTVQEGSAMYAFYDDWEWGERAKRPLNA